MVCFVLSVILHPLSYILIIDSRLQPDNVLVILFRVFYILNSGATLLTAAWPPNVVIHHCCLFFSCTYVNKFTSNRQNSTALGRHTIFDQNKPFSYAYILTTINPIDMIQSAGYSSYLVLNSSYFCRLSHEVFVKLSKPLFFTFFYMEQGMRSRSHICVKDVYRICVYYYIYMVAIP